MANVDKQMGKLLGMLILVVAATALAPDIFSNIADMESDTNTPAWVSALFYVIAGIGLVFLIWKIVDSK